MNFEERAERRKGNRRRGYRRIDDRNLVSRAQEEALSIKDSAAREGYQEGLRAAQEEVQVIKDSVDASFLCLNGSFWVIDKNHKFEFFIHCLKV